ncbi:hypothetical protein PR048_024728 [Dryococelus australis]|uniref:Uncharacterized protein n=1 Tax=Dryococelus australis TaxID=614101 RepID=A0ABQ9GPG0_9NEOP|nr:hypothetical protein PR048_024728 [Dryococelus australis]
MDCPQLNLMSEAVSGNTNHDGYTPNVVTSSCRWPVWKLLPTHSLSLASPPDSHVAVFCDKLTGRFPHRVSAESLIEARYRRQDCAPVQCFARRGDERVYSHVSIAPSAPTTFRPQTCKIPSTRRQALRRTEFNPRPGHRIFASGNRAGRCFWSAGFLGDLPFPPLLHSGAASYSLQSPSSALKTSLLRAAKISLLTSVFYITLWSRAAGGAKLSGSGMTSGAHRCAGPRKRNVFNSHNAHRAGPRRACQCGLQYAHARRSHSGSTLVRRNTSGQERRVTSEPQIVPGVRRGFEPRTSRTANRRRTSRLRRGKSATNRAKKCLQGWPNGRFLKTSLTSGIVRHNSHLQISMRDPGSPRWEASSLATTSPRPRDGTALPFPETSKTSAAPTTSLGSAILVRHRWKKQFLCGISGRGAALDDRLARSSSTKANRVQSPAGSLQDFRKLESCRTMSLVGGFHRGSPVSPPPPIPALLHTPGEHSCSAKMRHLQYPPPWNQLWRASIRAFIRQADHEETQDTSMLRTAMSPLGFSAPAPLPRPILTSRSSREAGELYPANRRGLAVDSLSGCFRFSSTTSEVQEPGFPRHPPRDHTPTGPHTLI